MTNSLVLGSRVFGKQIPYERFRILTMVQQQNADTCGNHPQISIGCSVNIDKLNSLNIMLGTLLHANKTSTETFFSSMGKFFFLSLL